MATLIIFQNMTSGIYWEIIGIVIQIIFFFNKNLYRNNEKLKTEYIHALNINTFSLQNWQ